MLKFSELIKTEVETIPEKQRKKATRSIKQRYDSNPFYKAYTIQTSDGVEFLVLDIYRVYYNATFMKVDMELVYRHFISKAPEAQYATYDVPDKIRSQCSLRSCLSTSSWYYDYHSAKSFSKEDLQTIEEFTNDIGRDNYYCPEPIDVLISLESRIDGKKEKAKATKIYNANQQRMEQLHNIPDRFNEWIEETVLRDARYFLYKSSEKGKARGFCSRCKKSFTASGIRQGKKVICPKCGTELTCKCHSKTDDKIEYIAHVSFVDRIMENDVPVLVLRYFSVDYIIENWKSGSRKTKKTIKTFEYQRCFMNEKTLEPQKIKGRWSYGYGWDKYSNEGWIDTKRHPHSFREKNWCFPDNLNEIAQEIGGRIKNIDFVEFANHIERDFYAICITLWHRSVAENFVKQGLNKFAKNIVEYDLAGINHLVNKNEMSVAGFLGVDRPTVRAFAEIDISCIQFIFFKEICKDTPNSTEILKRYIDIGATKLTENIKAIRNYNISHIRLLNYLDKQAKIAHRSGGSLIPIYRDYLSMAEDMKFDMANDSILFPKDVRKEHDRLMVIKETRANKALEAKLRRRTKKLEMLSWANDDFIIRPLRTSKEFINESVVLSHCVKTYIKRCSEGETNIFGIRKVNNPDEPYYTLTLSNSGQITTNLGKRNCAATEEVKEFASEWHKKIVKPKLEEFIKLINPKDNRSSKTQTLVRIGA